MQPGTLIIPIAFVLLVSMLIWLVIGIRGRWWLKLILIVLIPLFGFEIWQSLDSYLGWPTSEILPQKAILIWVEVNEPNLKMGNQGAIYLLLKPRAAIKKKLFGYIPDSKDPRVYKLPYSRQVHKQARDAQSLLLQDRSVEVEFKNGPKGYGYGGGSSNGSGSVIFYELPPPKFPPK